MLRVAGVCVMRRQCGGCWIALALGGGGSFVGVQSTPDTPRFRINQCVITAGSPNGAYGAHSAAQLGVTVSWFNPLQIRPSPARRMAVPESLVADHRRIGDWYRAIEFHAIHCLAIPFMATRRLSETLDSSFVTLRAQASAGTHLRTCFMPS